MALKTKKSLIPITQIEKETLKDQEIRELFQVGLVLFTSLCNNVMSPDVMYLSFMAARAHLKGLDIDESRLEFLIEKYAELAETSRVSNPMTKIFWG